jgi:hypothetical protein
MMKNFGYFNLDGRIVTLINNFLDNWEKGHRNYSEYIIEIPKFILVKSDYIYDEVYERKNSEFKGIKLDSINYLNDAASSDTLLTKEAIGSLIISSKDFYVQSELFEGENRFSSIIYRSSIFSFWKINHLLNRKNPI